MGIIAIFCGDVHITDKKPIARCDEPDWEEAQFRVLDFVKNITDTYKCPLFIGGDFLDKPVIPFGLFNKIKLHLPDSGVYCLLGNHEQVDKRTNANIINTSWYALQYLGCKVFSEPTVTCIGDVKVGLIPATNSEEEFIDYVENTQNCDVIVMHKYVWSAEVGSYPGANENHRADNISNMFPNAKVIFCSDNHKGFRADKVVNCGMLIRDNADLVNYTPHVWALDDAYNVYPIEIPTDLDLITDRHLVASKEAKKNEAAFIRTLGDSKDISLSFEDNLKKVLERLDNKACVEYITSVYESIKKGYVNG